MPKQTTLDIQNAVLDLGKRLGFDAVIEESRHSKELYAPIYDAVWYIDLTKYFDFSKIKFLFGDSASEWMAKFKKFPFAGFEIEGAGTSCKNQLGNFANLFSGDFLYNFVIVNNAGAKDEEDTYRRGLKLNRYMLGQCGYHNTFFFDSTHLFASIENVDFSLSNDVVAPAVPEKERRGTGGESKSIPLFNAIKDALYSSGLSVCQDCKPEIYRFMYERDKSIEVQGDEAQYYLHKVTYKFPTDTATTEIPNDYMKAYYVPKIDVMLGFNAPRSFVSWLKALAVEMKATIMDSPILYALHNNVAEDLFVPLIAIEIESGESKHQHGGIFNASKNAFAGVLVTDKSAEKFVEFYRREFGLKNIINYIIGG